MNLSIDIGNYKVKLAVFKADKIIELSSFSKEDLIDKLLEIKLTYPIKSAILATVAVLDPKVLAGIESVIPVIKILDINLKFPFQINYKTKETWQKT